jgi:hypothetical protein
LKPNLDGLAEKLRAERHASLGWLEGIPHGGTIIVRWTLRVGLGSLLLLALPLCPLAVTVSSGPNGREG